MKERLGFELALQADGVEIQIAYHAKLVAKSALIKAQ